MNKPTVRINIPHWLGEAFNFVEINQMSLGENIMRDIFTTFAHSKDLEFKKEVESFQKVFEKRPKTHWKQLQLRYRMIDHIPYMRKTIVIPPDKDHVPGAKAASIFGCWKCKVSVLDSSNSRPCTKCKGRICNRCNSCLCQRIPV